MNTIDYTSEKNQRILGKLVQMEVIHNASILINSLGREHQIEVAELFYNIPDYSQALENYLYDLTKKEKKQLLKEYDIKDLEDLDAEQICHDKELDYDYHEPLCFYIVSDWLGRKLEEKGQIVAEFMGFTIWGRLTFGQAILLDYVIGSIGEEMEILEGMRCEWS